MSSSPICAGTASMAPTRGKHSDMNRDLLRVRVPNPHQGCIGRDLLARILGQAGVSKDEGQAL